MTVSRTWNLDTKLVIKMGLLEQIIVDADNKVVAYQCLFTLEQLIIISRDNKE